MKRFMTVRLCFSPNTDRLIKLRRTIWARHLALRWREKIQGVNGVAGGKKAMWKIQVLMGEQY